MQSSILPPFENFLNWLDHIRIIVLQLIEILLAKFKTLQTIKTKLQWLQNFLCAANDRMWNPAKYYFFWCVTVKRHTIIILRKIESQKLISKLAPKLYCCSLPFLFLSFRHCSLWSFFVFFLPFRQQISLVGTRTPIKSEIKAL